jgi:hypothetical protein
MSTKDIMNKVVYNGTYTIHSDGTVDVNGDVGMDNMNLTEMRVKFGKVTGNFNCPENQLASLEGAPQSVGGDFNCSYNQLTSLVGAPQSVGGDFICIRNNLSSMVGAPQSVGFLFYIDLSYIYKKYYHVIIPEIEELISKGINLYKPDKYYYPYKEIHYKNKLIELL